MGKGTGGQGRTGKERERRGWTGAPFSFLPPGAAHVAPLSYATAAAAEDGKLATVSVT